MQLSKPRLYEVYAFDATKNYTFKFEYTSGQAEWHELRIENSSGVTIYKKRYATRLTKHDLLAGTHSLVNDKNERYKAYVTIGTTINGQEIRSAESDWVSFHCFDSPIIAVSGVTNQATVQDSTLELLITYTETTHGDTLNSYQVIVKNDLGQEIGQSSGPLYANGATRFVYLLTNLEDNHRYYLQVTCETTNHMVGDSGAIEFHVEYINPSTFANLECTNMRKEGQVRLRSNIVSILGKCGPTSRTGKLEDGMVAMPKYINNREIDVTGDGHWVVFDENFDVSSNFTMQLIVRKPNPYKNILTLYNGTTGVTGPLITVPLYDDYDTPDIIENHPAKTNVFDGKYIEDMVNPPSSDWWAYTMSKASGDANGDGDLNTTDSSEVLKYVNQMTELTSAELASADINRDGLVDVNDSSLITERSGAVKAGDMITVKYMLGDFAIPTSKTQSYVDAPVRERAYVVVRTENGTLNNVVHSNLIAVPSSNTYLHIWIQRVNNVLTCKVAAGAGGVEEWR